MRVSPDRLGLLCGVLASPSLTGCGNGTPGFAGSEIAIDANGITGVVTSADGPDAPGDLFDGVHAFVDGKFITLGIPYPPGFDAKGFEGRIDDPDAGRNGRDLRVPSGDCAPWLQAGGKGTKPLVVRSQVRPDPLAK